MPDMLVNGLCPVLPLETLGVLGVKRSCVDTVVLACDGECEQPPQALPWWPLPPALPCMAALAGGLLCCLLEASRLWWLFLMTEQSQGL